MRFKAIIIALLLFTISNLFGKSDNLNMFTEQYPPYNMMIDGKLTGISVKILDVMLKQVKSQQSLRDVKLTNWARVYSLTQKLKKISYLNQYKIEAIPKDIGGILLLSNGVKKEDTIDIYFQKMKKNRIDMFYYAIEVAFANRKAKGFYMNKYEVIHVL